MSVQTYILCPGQGSQHVGMGNDVAEKFAVARAVYDKANAVLGFDLADLCFNGPDELLNQTDISQPAIYVTSIACFAAAKEAGLIHPEQVAAYAGLSLGEYTALHLGGAFSFEDGLKLVAARGTYMQEAAIATPSGMVAVLGADQAAVESLCAENAAGEVLVLANYNAPGQIVVSGTKTACERFTAAAGAAGFKAIPLVVAGAFHSPLMQSGADKMQAELATANISSLRQTVYSNVTGHPHTDAASIVKLLDRSVAVTMICHLIACASASRLIFATPRTNRSPNHDEAPALRSCAVSRRVLLERSHVPPPARQRRPDS